MLLFLTLACTGEPELTPAQLTDADGDGSVAAEDCDDNAVGVHPGAIDIPYDGIDSDCDGSDDFDVDGDGFTSAAHGGDDCNDVDPDTNPDADDPDGDGIDSNCDGSDGPVESDTDTDADSDADTDSDTDADSDSDTDSDTDTDTGGIDNDGDGFPDGVDCDDDDDEIYPGADEICDGVDNDCNNDIDDGLPLLMFWEDADSDTFGDPGSSVLSCGDPGSGFVDNDGDCDDNDDLINPPADEVCDGADNNCDGAVDFDAVDRAEWWPDSDGDGYGDENASSTLACVQPSNHIDNNADCDDNMASVNPGATEAECDGFDNDCDPVTEDDPDLDSDGVSVCSGDCDDDDDANFPGNDEVCDGQDNDCDAVSDNGAIDQLPWYPDGDTDNYGDDLGVVMACDPPLGFIAIGGDCDDGNDQVNPVAVEFPDGLDNNCDGMCDGGLYGAGDLLITEVMANPDAVPDSDGEWIEVRNESGGDVYFCEDWQVRVEGTPTAFPPVPHFIPSGGYAIVVKNASSGVNGGVNFGHEVVGFAIPNSGSPTVELVFGGVTIDASSHFGNTSGVASQLDLTNPDNDDPANICNATLSYGAGDLGTPGQANGACADPVSCAEILALNPGSPSGFYTIDPDGPGGNADFNVYCDMTTDNGGWTIVTSVSGADGEENLISDVPVSGDPFAFQSHNLTLAQKMAINDVSSESIFIRDTGVWLKADDVMFDNNLATPGNEKNVPVNLEVSDGTLTNGWMGYTTINVNFGGDFHIAEGTDGPTCSGATVNGLDLHSTQHRYLNCGCERQYFYSRVTDGDNEAGYDAFVALGAWTQTSACGNTNGGAMPFYAAMR